MQAQQLSEAPSGMAPEKQIPRAQDLSQGVAAPRQVEEKILYFRTEAFAYKLLERSLFFYVTSTQM